jgi:hypothetical protein
VLATQIMTSSDTIASSTYQEITRTERHGILAHGIERYIRAIRVLARVGIDQIEAIGRQRMSVQARVEFNGGFVCKWSLKVADHAVGRIVELLFRPAAQDSRLSAIQTRVIDLYFICNAWIHREVVMSVCGVPIGPLRAVDREKRASVAVLLRTARPQSSEDGDIVGAKLPNLTRPLRTLRILGLGTVG